MTNYIWIKLQKDGFHNWPNANKQVSYLKHKHWHNFQFKIFIEVEHNDREIEFHMFRQYVRTFINKWPNNLRGKSCEMLADIIYQHIKTEYPNRKVKIEISEDGQNGVEMIYPNQ